MNQEIIIWLFGGYGAAIAAAFAFAWACSASHARDQRKLKDELYSYKIHVAEHFASVTYTAAIERRTVDALNEIKESLKEQGAKIDRLVERGTK